MRWGVRRERSDEKESVEAIVVRGTSDSFSIVMRRPRCDSVETRVWNAVWSSWDAMLVVSRVMDRMGDRLNNLPDIPDCILNSGLESV